MTSLKEKKRRPDSNTIFQTFGNPRPIFRYLMQQDEKRTREKRRKVLVVEPKVEDLNEVKEEILGSVELDENSYMLNL